MCFDASADSKVGVVVLQAPPIPKIDHEVPIIETRAMRERAAELSRMKERQARELLTSSRPGRKLAE